MVVCGGVTAVGGEVPEEVVMAGSEECCDESMSDVSITTSSTTMLASGAAEEAFSASSCTEDDEVQMMVVDDDDDNNHSPQQKFFCSTPMQSACPSPVSSASPSPLLASSPSLAAAVSMVTASDSDDISSSSSESSVGAASSFSTPLPNLGAFSLASSLPSCPPSHRHHHATSGGAAPLSISQPQHPQLLPLPFHQDLHTAILEAVALEPKYQPSLSLSMVPNSGSEISGRMRNGSCHVLRCLKVWYDLPCDTFFLAVNTMDRFLTRMRAQPKHLSCIAVSAFHIACEEMVALSGVAAPSRDSVSVISQSKCTAGDVQRMEDIIRNKLDLGPSPCDAEQAQMAGPGGHRDPPVTPLAFLKLLYAGHCQLLDQHFPSQRPDVPALLPLAHKLEVVVCDTRSANLRPAALAITILKRELLAPANCPTPDTIAAHTACLQPLLTLCKVGPGMLTKCEQLIDYVLKSYDSPADPSTALYHRQRLVWKLSNRTLRTLRPIEKMKRGGHRMEQILEYEDRTYMGEQTDITWPQPSRDFSFEEDDDHDYSKIHFDMSLLPPVAEGWNGDESAYFSSEETDSDEEASEVMLDSVSEEMDSGCDQVQQETRSDTVIGEMTAVVAEEEEESMDTEEDGGQVIVTSDQLPSDVVGTEVVMEEVAAVDDERASAALSSVATPLQETPASTGSGSDKEESYSQVAKKMKEDVISGKSAKVGEVARRALSTLPVTTHISPYNATNALQISPLSKITVTPAPASSSVRRNLTSLLTAQFSEEDDQVAGINAPSSSSSSLYSYHHRRVFGIVNLEHPEGGVMEETQLPCSSSATRNPFVAKNAKRKKQLLKLQLVAQFRLDNSSDSEMPSEHASSSSEEEMDSDYEKEFPPLPLPRTPPNRRLTTTSSPTTAAAALLRAAPASAASFIINKKNKKKSDVPSPYAAKTKAMRKMHAPRPMVVAQ